MELLELIEVRKQAHVANDPILKMLTEIQKMESKRAGNLFPLIEKVKQLERQLGEMTNPIDADVHNWLQEYRHGLDIASSDRRNLFGSTLADDLASIGLKLKGQYPKLHAGLFTFDLNFDKGRCLIWYGPEQERMAETALESKKVVDAVSMHRSRLGSRLEPMHLLANVKRAFRHVRLDYGNGPLPLLALLPFMALFVQNDRFLTDPQKDNYVGYGRADFSYDLYRLREVDSRPFLTIASRQQTQKRSDFLWIPSREDVEEGSYFAKIDFREE